MLGMSINEGNGCKCGTGEGPCSLKNSDVADIVGILFTFLRIY
jgi:hypothetical protein